MTCGFAPGNHPKFDSFSTLLAADEACGLGRTSEALT